ncbi:prolow-density lipoprotein receptor-related protein 1-like, partial [Saccoglossus kowalevskii]
IDECQIFGTCSHECHNTKGSFECFCAEGFIRESHACRADGSFPYLIIPDDNELRQIDTGGQSSYSSMYVGGTGTRIDSIDVHFGHRTLFWTNSHDKTINRRSLSQQMSSQRRKRDASEEAI